MLVLIVGPSGAGKDTLLDGARRLLADDNRFRFARRAITRPAEAGGEDHEPVDATSFELRRAAGAYALAWEAHGLHYGISNEIGLDLAEGRVVVASVSRGVVAEAAHRFPVRIVEITAPADVLGQRLAGRGREAAQDIAERLARRVDWDETVERLTVVNDGTVEEGT
ncbi:MAG: phosphonate metabolism protein/1,5-bisphosphokinase (PRPP-forming) PhnN, partial [Acidisphaera sp.]|nr:phosphonate metabolism protein/1,5-bisphosphokinase (PRPP-forming) PhnN [Acidisphaera sp.]